MKMKTKSQASVEYLMVVGLAFVIIMPMVYMFYSYTTAVQEDVSMAKIHKIGIDIVHTAEQVYYLGEPSRSTININMPENVYNITVMDSVPSGQGLVVFYYGDAGLNRPIVIPSKIPLKLGTLSSNPGRKVLVIEARADRVLVRGQE